MDLVLSSGFLAFCRQTAFLAAVEEKEIPVDGVCGTSSGALCSALWLAGASPREVLHLLAAKEPLGMVGAAWPPWKGLFSTERLLSELKQYLPAKVEDLPKPFGVGVVNERGEHQIRSSGPLPELVVASCSMPHIFQPRPINGSHFHDGGAVDRLGIVPWMAHRGKRQYGVHWVARSHGPGHGGLPEGVQVVRSPKSGAKLWGLGDIIARHDRSKWECMKQLQAWSWQT